MNEVKLMRKFMSELEKGIRSQDKLRCQFYRMNERYTVGFPDYIGIVNGDFVAIEFKKHGEKLELIQKIIRDEILKAEGTYVVIYLKEVGKAVTCLLEKAHLPNKPKRRHINISISWVQDMALEILDWLIA